jgi:hypothetical protein
MAGVGLLALTGTAAAADLPVRPMFVHGINAHPPAALRPTAGSLPTWDFKWSYQGTAYDSVFVGTDPSKGSVSTTVPVYIIPVKLSFNNSGKVVTADPSAKDYTGHSPVTRTVSSPLFHDIDYIQGGTNLGTTQYEDAFQRAALWGEVSLHKGYHVLLGTPTVEKEVSFTIPAADSIGVINAFGVSVLTADINWFDSQITPLLTKLNIPVDSLPIFVTTQTYLTENGGQCCIGGYHSFTGVQAYSHFTFISNSGSSLAFSQDVSALSHEVGEWLDDPFTTNYNVPLLCAEQGNGQQIYEVGDPIEVDANYGDYAYTLKGATYHLQDLVLPPYFGAPTSTSVNGWTSFQGTSFSVCQNGG